jgi:hypothetical protein
VAWTDRLQRMNPLLHRVFGREEVFYCSTVDNSARLIRPIEIEGAETEDESPGRVMRLEVLPTELLFPPATSDTVQVGTDLYIVVRVEQTITGVYQLTLHKDG